jgi:two-component system uhpT operon response regulator UhpA
VSSVAIHALRAGANGYITKDSDPELLLAAIRKVAGGARYIDPVLAENIAYNTTFPEQTMLHGQLSSRELEVFQLLAAGRNLNEIAVQLHLSNKTISTYKARIMFKMGFNNIADLFRYAVEHKITG